MTDSNIHVKLSGASPRTSAAGSEAHLKAPAQSDGAHVHDAHASHADANSAMKASTRSSEHSDAKASSHDARSAHNSATHAEARSSKTRSDSGAPTAPDAASGIIQTARSAFSSYVDKHGHAMVYAVIGLVAAILILTIGFWPVVLLALLAAAGFAIGRYFDGDKRMHATVGTIATHFKAKTHGRSSL